MEQLLRRGAEVTVLDMRLGDGYYTVQATYWGQDRTREGYLLVKFEGHIMSVTPERVTFNDRTNS